MTTLQERIAEVMAAMGWRHADLVRISGESSSLVSQWRGNAARPVGRITKMEAAERMEAASGFAALWIATGKGPKHAREHVSSAVIAGEPLARYGAAAAETAHEDLVAALAAALDALPVERLPAAQAALHALAAAPDSRKARSALVKALA